MLYSFLFPKLYGRSFRNPINSNKSFYLLNYDILKANTLDIVKSGSPKIRNYKEISNDQLRFSPLPMYLRWEDRNSMTHSIEARVPFLDHRLVEFCHSLPREYIDIHGMSKRILLEAMKDIIPYEIYQRKDKMGFVAPDRRWVSEEYSEKFRVLLNDSIQYSKGIIKSEALHYFENVIANKENFNFSYWCFIMFGHWMKVFGISL